jgi:hypothetical protein
MQILLTNAYLSIVADRNNPDRMIVRARRQGHIEAVFPEANVITRPDTEYRYRAFIDRKVVEAQLATITKTLDYDDF